MILKEDIVKKINSDFGRDASQAIEIIVNAIAETDDLASPRIIRCIIYLSEGNIDKLKHHIQAAKQDPRDVMLWAEYENIQDDKGGYVRKRDFSKTFLHNNPPHH